MRADIAWSELSGPGDSLVVKIEAVPGPAPIFAAKHSSSTSDRSSDWLWLPRPTATRFK